MLQQSTESQQQDLFNSTGGQKVLTSAERSDIRARLARLNQPFVEVQVEAIAVEPSEPTQAEPNNGQANPTVETEASKVKKTEAQAETESHQEVSGLAISFGKTLPELLSGNKTQTRRDWSDGHAAKFRRAYREGKLVKAIDKDRRVPNSKQVGLLRLTAEPCEQALADMSPSDVAAEGFPAMSRKGFIDRFFGGDEGLEVWVLEFEFIPDEPTEPTEAESTEAETNEPGEAEAIVTEEIAVEAVETEATQADAIAVEEQRTDSTETETETEPSETETDADESAALWTDLPEPGTQGAEEALARALQKSDREGLLAAIKAGDVLLQARKMFANGDDDDEGEGEKKPQGFVKWINARGFKNNWAYNRMNLAKAYQRICERSESLTESVLVLFNQTTFGEFAKSSEEFQDWLLAKIEIPEFLERFAPNCIINSPALNKFKNMWVVENSALVPKPLKERCQNPEQIQALAQISEKVEQLPESAAEQFSIALKENNPELKQIAISAKEATEFVEKTEVLQSVPEEDNFIENVLNELLRIGGEGLGAKLSKAAAKVEKCIAELFVAHREYLSLSDRLFVDTGASTPQTREYIKALERNIGPEKCSITLGSGKDAQEISVYFKAPPQEQPVAPAAPAAEPAEAESADSESLHAIAEKIEQLRSDCPELPHAVNGARVKISKEDKRFPGAVATVKDDRDQDRVTVLVGDSNIEPVLPASELTPYKPRQETISVEVINQQLGQLRRAIDLTTIGASKKIQELSAQNHTLEQELKDQSQRIGKLKNETASINSLQLINQKLSADLEAARAPLADVEGAKQRELDLKQMLERKEEELRRARASALVSPDANDKISALKEGWDKEKAIIMQRLRNADWKIDELEKQLENAGDSAIAEDAIGSISKACEKLGLIPPIVEEPTLEAILKAIRGCGQTIVDWVTSQEAKDWQAA